MAIFPYYPNIAAPVAGPDSDYGSDIDIEDAVADALLSQAELQSPKRSPTKTFVQSIEQPAIAELEEDVFTHNFSVRLARLQKSQQNGENVQEGLAELDSIESQRRRLRGPTVEVEYDERNRMAFSPSNPEEPTDKKAAEPKPKKKDTRSPLQRFKSRRPLSVTNLVSPSWCGQQYEYNLSHHGRIPQTRAMTAGSTAHKELEEQVHVEVPVEVVTREDRHGLKMWNTIQGLRALRETGLTRELEVWSVLEGEVVNGIIDEVTVECPDTEMESRILQHQAKVEGGKAQGNQLPPDQRTLTDYLTSSQGGSVLERSQSAPLPATLQDHPTTTYYLKDIKTTKRSSPPAGTAYTRGAHFQLMLYHRMLSSLAANEVPAQQVFDRYNLNAEVPFSDKFIAELANLDMRAFIAVPDEADLHPSEQTQQQDPLTELLEHNTLTSLWTLLITELQRTFPRSPDAAHSATISPLLTVEYRNPTPQEGAGNTLIGTRSFPFEPKKIDTYVKDEIRWWRGLRETVGVSVEDAWKCGWCEFKDSCEWRATKVEEGLERARLRREGLGGRSGV